MITDPALEPAIQAWLNRLSDVLWLCAQCEGK
jgi:cob(I)alamin adenosyltransferase